MKIALDVHNMSNSRDALVRTGIQEVSYQCFRSLCLEDTHQDGVEFLPILAMTHLDDPKLSGSRLPGFFLPTYYSSTPHVLELALESFGLSKQGLLEKFPCTAGFFSSEPQVIWQTITHILGQADAYLSLPLCDVRHLFEWTRTHNPRCLLGQLVHDVGPALRSEFVVDEMWSWFVTQGVETLRDSDYLISVSAFTASETEKLLGRRQARLLANNHYVQLPKVASVSTSERSTLAVLQKYGLRERSYFLSAGTLEPRKNTILTIQAYQRFLERFGHRHKFPPLVVTGSKGWMNGAILKALEQKALKEHVKALGFVSDHELMALTSQAAALSFPSHYEGFGIPPARALEFGTPVIVTPLSSLPEACWPEPRSATSDSASRSGSLPGTWFVNADDVESAAAAFAGALRSHEPEQGPGQGTRDQNASRSVQVRAPAKSRDWSDFLGDLATIIRDVVPASGQASEASHPARPLSEGKQLRDERGTQTRPMAFHAQTSEASLEELVSRSIAHARRVAIDASPNSLARSQKSLGHLLRTHPDNHLPACDTAGPSGELRPAWREPAGPCPTPDETQHLLLPALVTDSRLQDTRKPFRDPASAVTASVLADHESTSLASLGLDARLLLIEPRSITECVAESDVFLSLSPTRFEDMRNIELLQQWKGLLIALDHPQFTGHPNLEASRKSMARWADVIVTHDPDAFPESARDRIIRADDGCRWLVTIFNQARRH